MTTSESQYPQLAGPAVLQRVQPLKEYPMETSTTPTAEGTVGIIPPKAAALTLEQRDEIKRAALAHADACRADQQHMETGSDQAGAAAVNATLHALNRQLDQATTTSIDTLLLERTLERDALIVERDALLVRNADLAIERDGREARTREITADRDHLLAVRNAGTDEADLLLQRYKEMVTKCEELSARGASVEAQFEAFKQKVVEVADQYAKEHGWCDVIDAALEELGLERAPKEYRAKLTITLDVYGTLANGRRDLPEGDWVRDSIGVRAIERAIRDSIAFDDDHASGSVEDFEFEVDDVQGND